MGRPPGSKNRRSSQSTGFVIRDTDDGEAVTAFDTHPAANGGTDTATGTGSADGGAADNIDRGYGFKPDGSPRLRRPNGSGPQKARKLPLDLKGIEAMLHSIHGMGALMLKIPELAISEQESAMMAQGIANVAKHYPDTAISEKTLAWSNLLMVMAGVYGTRAVAISNNRKREKVQAARAQAAQQAADNITPFTTRG